MSDVLVRRWKVSLLSLLFSFILLVTAPSPVFAKTPAAFAFDTENSPVVAAAIYETGYSTQKTVVKGLKAEKALVKKAAGFEGMSVFQSEDGLRVVVLSQWQDAASFQAYRATAQPAAASSALQPPAPDRLTLFEIVQAQTYRAGVQPTIRGKEAIVQFSELSLSDSSEAADPAAMQSHLQPLIDSVLQKQPSPQSVLLLKSADPPELALLVNWNCTADFAETGKPLGVEVNDPMLAPLAADQRFYNVVRIMPASPEKKKSKED